MFVYTHKPTGKSIEVHGNYSYDQVDTLVNLYEECKPWEEIARETGIAPGSGQNLLKRLEVLRNQSEANRMTMSRAYKKDFLRLEKEAVQMRVKTGLPASIIAKELEVCQATVEAWFKKNDIMGHKPVEQRKSQRIRLLEETGIDFDAAEYEICRLRQELGLPSKEIHETLLKMGHKVSGHFIKKILRKHGITFCSNGKSFKRKGR